MNKNSNAYIITYATVMVVIVAAILTIASLVLKERQEQNVVMEKRHAILASIGQGKDADKVADKTQYINDEYSKYIKRSLVVDTKGKIIEGANAFNILIGLKSQYDKSFDKRELPIFIADVNGKVLNILPVWGKGLWGPVWGYVAIENDWTTISGVVYDHKSETPGLGAEITTAQFTDQFVGKKIFNGVKLVSIKVLKGVGSSKGNISAVDGISGGTITSLGVQNMLLHCLDGYKVYMEEQINKAITVEVADSVNQNVVIENYGK